MEETQTSSENSESPPADEEHAPDKGEPAPGKGEPAPGKGEPAPGKGEPAPDKGEHMDEANLRYEGDLCIHTDPETKFQHCWNDTSQSWVPYENVKTGESSTETVTNAKDGAPPGNYEYDGDSYVYKDSSGVTYKWDSASNDWTVKSNNEKEDAMDKKSGSPNKEQSTGNQVPGAPQDMSSGQYGFEGDTHTYTDPSDGTVYLWDREKNAWFPKVDDDFMAKYQMSYGFVDPTADNKQTESSQVNDEKDEDDSQKGEKGVKRKGAPNPPQWFELEQKDNTKVYVSNLPSDITLQEFVDVMQKCGLIMRDVDTGNMKVKLYSEPGNSQQLKGDGLCTYIKKESVELALNVLDGYDIRGQKLKVEPARFELKGKYNPDLKPKKKRRKDKEKIKKAQEKLFDWRPDKLRGERSKHERTVIVKNLFEPKSFDMEVGLILEYQQDLREECSKCGTVKKVIIYDRHPEGVAQISFKSPEEADLCVQLLNNRWFGQRKITAETWDGKTKYKIAETPQEAEARLAKWTKYLESEEAKKSALEQNHNAGLEGGIDEKEDEEEEEKKISTNDENGTKSNSEVKDNSKAKNPVPGDDSDTESDDKED